MITTGERSLNRSHSQKEIFYVFAMQREEWKVQIYEGETNKFLIRNKFYSDLLQLIFDSPHHNCVSLS
jgi:hypothetical protein